MIALGTRRVNRYDCGKQTAQNDTESIAAQCLYTRSSNGERATERIFWVDVWPMRHNIQHEIYACRAACSDNSNFHTYMRAYI